MASVRLKIVQLAFAVGLLGTFSFAQTQDLNDAHVKVKWLDCDVSWIFTHQDVGSDFSLRISFHDVPLPGVRLSLARGGILANAGESTGFLADAVTDASGIARFFAVPPGKYSAVEEDGLFFPYEEIEVHADADLGEEIAMQWPLSSLPVRTLRGRLITSGVKTGVELPLSSATVDLLELRSSRVIETQTTEADGSYLFSTVEPGLYVVRITHADEDKKQTKVSADLSVELNPAARESTIPELKVVQSDCAGVQLLRRVEKHHWESPYSP
jgi:hypothetical protein